MVRLSVTVAAMVAAVGCTGLIDNHGGGLTPEEAIAHEKFATKALPVFKQECVACHASGDHGAPTFLAGATAEDIRTSLINENPQVVNPQAPASSRVLTKGLHSGPELMAQEAADILDWIQAEHDALPKDGDGGTTQLETALFAPQRCTSGAAGDTSGCSTGGACCPFNTVDLSIAPFNLPGASIKFIWQSLTDTDSYVNRLSLNASSAGAYIEHPLFVSWPNGQPPVPDTLDRFFNVKLDVAPNANSMINGGTAAFVGFVPTDKISISFKVVSPFVPNMGMPVSGCKVVSTFTAMVAPKLNQFCNSCHGGANQGAQSAVNMMGVANTGDMNAMTMVCNAIYSVTNLTDIPNSAVLLTPAIGGGTNHPFHFTVQTDNDAFVQAVTAWATAEKTAP
jgi:hypothetical protein